MKTIASVEVCKVGGKKGVAKDWKGEDDQGEKWEL